MLLLTVIFTHVQWFKLGDVRMPVEAKMQPSTNLAGKSPPYNGLCGRRTVEDRKNAGLKSRDPLSGTDEQVIELDKKLQHLCMGLVCDLSPLYILRNKKLIYELFHSAWF
jgi:hypothetical protein